MKIAIAAVLLLGLSAGAQAQDANTETGTQNLAKIKQNLIQKVEEQIQALEASKTCYAAAKDIGGLKDCRKQQRTGLRQAGKAEKQERLEQQQKRLEAKQKRIEERKKQLQDAQKAE